MYQPRGVGLIHTRHKSSVAYYTLAGASKRKCGTAGQAAGTGLTKSANTCRELPFCPVCRKTSDAIPLCWRGDLIRLGGQR